MRPTGPLHLGHYHGVIKNWIDLQDKYKCFFFVADWHALTTEYADPKDTVHWSYEMLLDWLSVGLDPAKSVMFIQSKILEHAELHVLLSMLTPLGWLNRVPSYKEIREQLTNKDLSTYGFLGYPLLQTADIVMYKASFVPVGEDQVAHVELAREIVRRYNFLYGSEVLVEPQSLLTHTPKVPGLDKRKMSKSYGNCIFMSDDAETLKGKIMPAVTDPARIRRTDPGNPEVCLIFDYHKLYTPKDELGEVDAGCRTAGIGCVDCKKKLLTHMNNFWEPVRQKRKELAADPKAVWNVVRQGNDKAGEIAAETMEHVREVMKLKYGEL